MTTFDRTVHPYLAHLPARLATIALRVARQIDAELNEDLVSKATNPAGLGDHISAETLAWYTTETDLSEEEITQIGNALDQWLYGLFRRSRVAASARAHGVSEWLFVAVDAQPGVDDDDLDPAVWIGDGVRGATTAGPELIRDNTARAGLALRAIQASAVLDEDAPVELRAVTAINAYLGTTSTVSWEPVDEETSDHVRDLIADMFHLADARGVPAASDLTNSTSPLHQAVRRLNDALQEVCRHDWSTTLVRSWAHILTAAAQRLENQIRGIL